MIKNRISEVLQAKGIQKKDFAKTLGVSPQYISGICSGALMVSLKKYEEIAEILDVPLSDVIVIKPQESTILCPHCGRPIRFSKEEEAE